MKPALCQELPRFFFNRIATGFHSLPGSFSSYFMAFFWKPPFPQHWKTGKFHAVQGQRLVILSSEFPTIHPFAAATIGQHLLPAVDICNQSLPDARLMWIHPPRKKIWKKKANPTTFNKAFQRLKMSMNRKPPRSHWGPWVWDLKDFFA